MEFTDEWKSRFPVGKVFTPPLLLSGPSVRSILGPLCFNPKPQTQTLLFSSPTLFHPIPSPPQVSLSKFLSASSLPFSTSSSIASQFGPPHYNDIDVDSYNCLQLLHWPNTNHVIAFFPFGYNHDQLGFLLFSVEDSGFKVLTDENDEIFRASNEFNYRICNILVNPVAEILGFKDNSSVTIGYLLVCTLYSAHWFSVEVNQVGKKPTLSYLGFKLFKGSSIVSASWSPHLVEESVVLLESGALFMFDLDSCLKTKKSNVYFKGKRLRVLWDDYYYSSRTCKWLGCDFSWHPRILIIARSDAVFLVDLRSDDCNITVLAKIDMLNLYAPIEKEQFLMFHKAGSDGYNFVLVSDSLLVLCDVRKPLTPVLQWAHSLHKPSYIDLFRLSELRANSRDNIYEWADEFGFGIVLGSFCNCEFSLFCYGPSLPSCGGPFASEIAKICKSIYAWDLPSELWLSGRDCCSGSCLTRKEFFKDTLPPWIDWKQKEDIVLGFGILNKDLSRLFHGSDEFGGFTLVRLMSSGKLEAQRYYASWDLVKKLEVAHGDSLSNLEDNVLCFMEDDGYKFVKKYNYFKFDYLYGYLSGNLTEVLDSKMRKLYSGPREKDSFSIDFHETLCEKLRICGFSPFRTSPAISFVFNDIGLPANIHEIALRRMWTCLPMELLQLAFSSYAEILDVLLNRATTSLEFSIVPDLHQLPPFYLRKSTCRSNKWSQKVQRGDSLVGPVLPLPVLLTLHEFRNGCSEEADRFSSEAEVNLCCDEVMQVAHEMAVLDSGFEFHNDRVVSLSDDRDNLWADSEKPKPKPFILYHLTALESSTKNDRVQNIYEDVRYTSLISKVSDYESCPKDTMDSAARDLLDDLSPIALKFDDASMRIMPTDLKVCNILKKDYSRFLENSSSYQDYCNQLKLKKQ